MTLGIHHVSLSRPANKTSALDLALLLAGRGLSVARAPVMTESPTPRTTGDSPRSGHRRIATWLLRAVAALAIGSVAWWATHRGPPPLAPVGPVTIAVPTQINSAPLVVAQAQGLFEKAGVTVAVQPFLLGKDALAALLEGKADLAVVADVPFVFARMAGKDVAIVAGISQARRTLAIAARADHGIQRVQDLAGKSVGLTAGTNFTYFLDAMLQVHGVDSARVDLKDMKVEAAVAALKEGKVDATVVFEPTLTVLKNEWGDRIKLFYGEDVYAFRYLLVGKPAYIDSHPQEVQRVLGALIVAAQSIRDQPVPARLAVGSVVKVDDAVMAQLFNPEDYAVSLDPALLLALDDETRWAMKRGLFKPGPIPNHLDAIRFAPLEAVSPSAVKVPH
jgi:NitT/TauT family transport system substrate-binding protein